MSTQLRSADLLDIADQYLNTILKLQSIVTDSTKPMEERIAAFHQSSRLNNAIHALQEKALRDIVEELGIETEEIKQSISDANQAVRNIQNVGKVIEVAADLVVIAGLLAAPKLAALPTLIPALASAVGELTNDVNG